MVLMEKNKFRRRQETPERSSASGVVAVKVFVEGTQTIMFVSGRSSEPGHQFFLP